MFKLVDSTETVAKLKPLLTSLTKLHTVSLNNMSFVESIPGGRVSPLLNAIIKHVPHLRHLSILRSNLQPDQVPNLVRALKKRVCRNPLTLYTKHMTGDGLQDLLTTLKRSKSLEIDYNPQTGVIDVTEKRKEKIIGKIKKLSSAGLF